MRRIKMIIKFKNKTYERKEILVTLARYIPQSKIFWGISSFHILAMFRRGLFYSYLSIYLRHYLGLNVTETTLMATLPMLSNIFFQTFVWGRISDKYQLRRTLIVWGEILAAGGTVILWYTHTLSSTKILSGYVIITGLTLIEAFWSMSNIGWSALISDVYSENKRSAVQGRLSSMGGLGRILGIWIGGVLYDGLGRYYSGWGFEKGALFFVASFAMLISVIPLKGLPEGGIKTNSPIGDNPSSLHPLRANSKNGLILFLIAMTFINFGRNSVALIQPQYLVLESGLAVSNQAMSYIVNSHSLAMVLTGIITGFLTARLGDFKALIIGTLAAIISLVIIGSSINLFLIYASNFIRGFSEVLIMAASYTVASVLIPSQARGRLFAIFNATFFLSWGFAGTLIAGPIVDILRNNGYSEGSAYQLSFICAAAITFIGMVLMLRQFKNLKSLI
jgi:MFS family permease